MLYTATPTFQFICRLVLFCFTLANFHPSSLRVPSTLALTFSTHPVSGLWTLDSRLFSLTFGPTPAYGNAQEPAAASTKHLSPPGLLITSDAKGPMVRLPGHVLPTLAHAKPMHGQSEAGADEPLHLTLVLKRDDQAGFDTYLRNVYDPLSRDYRKFLTQRELSDRFGPTQQAYDAVLGYLQDNGFTLLAASTNRMTLTFRSSRVVAERTFGLQIRDYKSGEKYFFANDIDPAVPLHLASNISAITGLSNMATPGPNTVGEDASLRTLTKNLIIGVVGALLAISATIYGLGLLFSQRFQSNLPPQNDPGPPITGVYEDPVPILGANPPMSATGAGQKIGVLAFSSFELSNVADWLALVGKPASLINQVSQVHVNGGASLGVDEKDVLLGIEAFLSLAPGAQIVVYDGPSSGPGTSFQALFNAMISDGVTIISNSFSYCEDQTTLADVQSIDAILATAAASGISVFNAAGDSGSTCSNGSPNTIAVPASSPNATTVGGSSITLGAGLTYGGESWWDGLNQLRPTGQGGFGLSRFFSRPTYQNGIISEPMRSIPDVVASADPRLGFSVCQANAGGCPTGTLEGGTSMAVAIWAAFTALLNEAHGRQLGFLNPLLYPLAGSASFHSATRLNSDVAHVGLGSPNVNLLSLALAGLTPGPVNPSRSLVEAFSALPEVPFVDTVPADGTTATAIVVRLRDADGYPVIGKTVTLSAIPSGNVVISPPSGVSSVDNGAVVFTVKSLVPETVTFTATDVSDGLVLAKQPTVTFTVPPATGASISPPALTVTADGISTAAIAVTLKDALNRPAAGKIVTLTQGNGHSVITGPNPSVTDSNGQIVFTATNLVNEVVTYTAVDVSDGNLPIPGSTVVTFTNGSGGACGQNVTPPLGLNGYTVTPFATGFKVGQLFYGNVNFGGCSGVAPPGFLDGEVYVPNFFNGELFKLSLNGGAVSNANKLSTIAPTLGWVVAGKDGKLYATRTAVDQFPPNFTNGAVVELDPITGAVKRTLVSNLPCSQGLVADPLSGDLFFDGQCFGAGSNNANLFRVRNPSSATPTLEVYATLPGSPNGQIAFSPKGTIYVVVNYLLANPPVYRVSGTNVPGTPTVTDTGVVSNYWLNIGNVDASGEATELVTLNVENNVGRLKLTSMMTNPPTVVATMAEGSGGGVIGPDGCLYMPNSNVLHKLTDPTGGCSFLPTNAKPAMSLTPATLSPNPVQGTSQTFTATIRNIAVPAGTPVTFNVIGPNLQKRLGRTDASGQASVSYVGTFTGKDQIIASVTVNGTNLVSNLAEITWDAGKHETFLTLNPSPKAGTPGQPVTVIASLTDSSVDPPAPVIGVAVTFALGSGQCVGTTDSNGLARCTLVPSVPGLGTLTATFDGNAQFLADNDSVAFNVLASAPSCIPTTEVCDGRDNDCDGQVDEGLGTLSCGVGECVRSVTACVNGVPQTCTPGTPTSEVCDGRDNNCNNLIDDGLGTLSCGVGTCARTVNVCGNGTLQVCTPGTPVAEICGDGIDQDCNGADLTCPPPPPTAKCPRSHGYWKTHPTAWPVASLQLGAQTYNKAELLSLLSKPSKGDASVILAHQLIAAKLNLAVGVNGQPVATTIADVDQRLRAYSGKLPYKVSPSSTAGKALVKAADKLEDFNEGELTPGCKDDHDDDEEDDDNDDH